MLIIKRASGYVCILTTKNGIVIKFGAIAMDAKHSSNLGHLQWTRNIHQIWGICYGRETLIKFGAFAMDAKHSSNLWHLLCMQSIYQIWGICYVCKTFATFGVFAMDSKHF